MVILSHSNFFDDVYVFPLFLLSFSKWQTHEFLLVVTLLSFPYLCLVSSIVLIREIERDLTSFSFSLSCCSTVVNCFILSFSLVKLWWIHQLFLSQFSYLLLISDWFILFLMIHIMTRVWIRSLSHFPCCWEHFIIWFVLWSKNSDSSTIIAFWPTRRVVSIFWICLFYFWQKTLNQTDK
jgi:hypothetical protein